MSSTILPGPLVNASWLARHLYRPEVIIFDASLATPGDPPITEVGQQIGNAQFFDINRICDPESELPHMMPTPEQFSEQVRELGVNDDSVVVVYDDKGIYSSARVWWMFKSMGFDQVAVLNGGLPAWRKEGFQCTVPAAKVALPKGNFTATGQEGYFCDVNRVLTALADPRVNVLDARSFSRFSGAEKDPRPGVRSGHMPGALNMHYASLFETEGERAGLMLGEEELALKFRKLSPNHRAMIFTCGSGVTACILALAATLLGYHEISVYDGSWSEWGRAPECPVVYT